jgi:lipooligosaccharide transport system permease protein
MQIQDDRPEIAPLPTVHQRPLWRRLNPQLRDLWDWRTRAVFMRNAQVWGRNWRTALIPPAMEPVVSLLAFGFGVGSFVGAMSYQSGGVQRSVDYASYMAPGLLAYAMFTSAFFEALYSSYVRMFYQKTWDGILATQVELRHIVWGEITWASARALWNATVVSLVLVALDLTGVLHLQLAWLPLLPLLGFVVGWAFGAFGLLFTAIVPSIDHMNYPVFLVGVPLGLVSNTYFPIDQVGPWARFLSQFNPIYHLSETCRAALLGGSVGRPLGMTLLTSAVLLVVCAGAVQMLMRRRVLGED